MWYIDDNSKKNEAFDFLRFFVNLIFKFDL